MKSRDTTRKTDELDPSADRRAAARQAEACLVFIHGPQLGELIPLRGEDLVLGRSDDCEVRVTGDGVSRRHCRVARNPGSGYFVEDLGSTNGTRINDEPVEHAPLRDGDLISVGSSVLKFVGDRNIEASYHSRVHYQVNRDVLTGLFNRRSFDSTLEVEVLRAIRYRRPLSVVLFDVDRFKSINDGYGHAAGDAVLRSIAQILSERTRRSDGLFRIGGDELALILPETSLDRAAAVAELYRELVASARFGPPDAPVGVTVSFGAAELAQGMERPDDLLRVADRRLYAAKAAGGDRVVSADLRTE